MSQAARRNVERREEPVRVLGRGLRAARGVHMTLRLLREGVGRTQVDVATTAKMDQGDISRLEARPHLDDTLVSTLARYVEALGGTLELTARFGDKRIVLVGAQTSEESP